MPLLRSYPKRTSQRNKQDRTRYVHKVAHCSLVIMAETPEVTPSRKTGSGELSTMQVIKAVQNYLK